MIGDLHQLSPVIKDDDWQMLKPYYETVYFFGSQALKRTNPVRIELTHIYRQSDTMFIDLLNRVRENQLDAQTLETLNQRFIPGFIPADDEGYITLTTHNASAQQINASKLERISEKPRTFEAVVSGDFPSYSYPTELTLTLKKGAQVMFVKNDPSRDKLYYNGKIGSITRISSDLIHVKCPGDTDEIEVDIAEWKNVKYTLNPDTKEIEEEILGSFSQYPLKLAWAITIHKSQGLTFEKAIIDANASFAHGQVYVALSRCKSFEGMVLSSRIGMTSVKTDGTVAAYSREASNNPPDNQALSGAKIDFQKSLIFELFDFHELKRAISQLKRLLDENAPLMEPGALNTLKLLGEVAESEIFVIGSRFQNQLHQLMAEDILPEDDATVKARIIKGAEYFLARLDAIFYPSIKEIHIETDNSNIKKAAQQALEVLQRVVFIKHACLTATQDGFQTLKYLRTRSDADIDFKARPVIPEKIIPSNKNIKNSKLYELLKAWRNSVAAENDVLDYMVLPMKTLLELAENVPVNLKELSKIKGIGKAKLGQYADEILEITQRYCKETGIDKTDTAETGSEEIPVRKIKTDTKRVSLNLFHAGKSIEEIALERGCTHGTIETHMLHFIGTGEADIFSIFNPETIRIITDYFSSNPTSTLTEAKTALGEQVSYTEIRATLMHLKGKDG